MGSFRAGQVFGALSSGLGLFAEKTARDEADRIDRDWQATLENMRETRAAARQEAGFSHSEQMARDADASAERRAAESNRSAESRFTQQQEATAAFRRDSMTAEEQRAQQTRVDRARENLQDNILALEKEQAKEMEAQGFNPEAQEAIMRRYTDLKDQAIVGTVSWLASNNLPGYEVKDQNGLQSLLIQSGMDVEGAGQHSKQIWSSISGVGAEDSLFQSNMAPEERAAREAKIAGLEQESAGIGPSDPGILGWLGSGGGDEQQAPPPAARLDQVTPGAPPPPTVAQPAPLDPTAPGYGQQRGLFDPPIQNPDGSPAHPMNRESLGFKAFEWLKSPSDELFN